jgi:hypothetical protein
LFEINIIYKIYDMLSRSLFATKNACRSANLLRTTFAARTFSKQIEHLRTLGNINPFYADKTKEGAKSHKAT